MYERDDACDVYYDRLKEFMRKLVLPTFTVMSEGQQTYTEDDLLFTLHQTVAKLDFSEELKNIKPFNQTESA